MWGAGGVGCLDEVEGDVRCLIDVDDDDVSEVPG